MALSVDQKSFAEFLPQELIGKHKRCSRRSSVEDAADGPVLSALFKRFVKLNSFGHRVKFLISGKRTIRIFFAESSDHFLNVI